ncbi:MAG: response regulator [Chloroflexi bacterium]|nr:response regulator [Chloroflexota bacterium]
MCQQVLNKEGFRVDIAVNGIVAQDMVEKRQYDICLIDIRTPQMNGAELYQWLQKKYPQLANRVIFTTGGVIDERIMPFIEHSGRLFLPKPFTPQELVAVAKEALKQPEK